MTMGEARRVEETPTPWPSTRQSMIGCRPAGRSVLGRPPSATGAKSLTKGQKRMSALADAQVEQLAEPVGLPRPSPPAPVEFHYTQDENFVAKLKQLGASLVITTYQANKLLVAR